MEQLTKKEIVTVAEMARMCGLSRSRFYSLTKDGIMPIPSRNPATSRPFYTREQQEQCLLVRRTNCGINGKPILFYTCNWSRQSVIPPRQTKSASSNRGTQIRVKSNQVDPMIEELREGLGQLGVADVTETTIRMALADEYPDGHATVSMPILLMTVFRRMNRQNSQDNLAR